MQPMHFLARSIVPLLPAGHNSPARHPKGTSPADIEHSWDAFYSEWVGPVVHFGTPALAVFAALLIMSRALTPIMLTTRSPGPRGAKLQDRARMAAMYWLGLIALLWAAVEAVVVFPLGRRYAHPQWSSMASLLIIAGSAAVVTTLYSVVGRPLRRQIYAPGVDSDAARAARRHDYARTTLAGALSGALIVVALTAANAEHEAASGVYRLGPYRQCVPRLRHSSAGSVGRRAGRPPFPGP